jgi:uncharacterized protein
MMKYLLVIVVVAIVLWIARSGQRAERVREANRKQQQRVLQHEQMVACAQCGLHVPASDALPGRGGAFCSEAHRSAYERAHPPS